MLHTGSDPIICLKAQEKHFDAWLLYGKATEARFGCSRAHCKAELVFRSRDFLVDGLAGTGKCEFRGAFQMQGDLCPRHGPGINLPPLPCAEGSNKTVVLSGSKPRRLCRCRRMQGS